MTNPTPSPHNFDAAVLQGCTPYAETLLARYWSLIGPVAMTLFDEFNAVEFAFFWTTFLAFTAQHNGRPVTPDIARLIINNLNPHTVAELAVANNADLMGALKRAQALSTIQIHAFVNLYDRWCAGSPAVVEATMRKFTAGAVAQETATPAAQAKESPPA